MRSGREKVPAYELNIKGRGYELRSYGWTVERMVLSEAEFEAETGERSPLKTLFDYWRETGWGHGAFAPLQELPIPVYGIDVGDNNPLRYRYTDYNGPIFGDLTGKHICELPKLAPPEFQESYSRLADTLSWEFAETKKAGVPLYYQLEHRVIGAFHRRYVKLLLPPVQDRMYFATRATNPIILSGELRDLARQEQAETSD